MIRLLAVPLQRVGQTSILLDDNFLKKSLFINQTRIGQEFCLQNEHGWTQCVVLCSYWDVNSAIFITKFARHNSLVWSFGYTCDSEPMRTEHNCFQDRWGSSCTHGSIRAWISLVSNFPITLHSIIRKPLRVGDSFPKKHHAFVAL